MRELKIELSNLNLEKPNYLKRTHVALGKNDQIAS